MRETMAPRSWLRILLVHPFALVLVAVVASYYLAWKASPGADTADDVWPFLYLLALAPLVSVLLTGQMLLRSSTSSRGRARLIVLYFVVGVAAASLGVVLWFDAIGIACQGRYECPL
jgi:hypothetical protein